MKNGVGLLPLLVGLALLAAPWWSRTLPAGDYPLTLVLGSLFAGIGLAVLTPDSWPRLRTLGFVVFFAAFGVACAAIAWSPWTLDASGHAAIGGSAGFGLSAPPPLWACLIVGAFGLLFLGLALTGLLGLVRGRESG